MLFYWIGDDVYIYNIRLAWRFAPFSYFNSEMFKKNRGFSKFNENWILSVSNFEILIIHVMWGPVQNLGPIGSVVLPVIWKIKQCMSSKVYRYNLLYNILDMSMYVPYSWPYGWTEWADFFLWTLLGNIS